MWIAWTYMGLAFVAVALFWLIVWTATAAIHQPPPSEDDEPDLFTANNAVRVK